MAVIKDQASALERWMAWWPSSEKNTAIII
jgi:hypothetical protein